MLAAVSLLLATPTTCARPPASLNVAGPTKSVLHAFQNGGRESLRLFWIDPQGKRIDQGLLLPGSIISMATFIGHAFVFTDTAGRCRHVVRIGPVLSGTYAGTSRYAQVTGISGWHVFVDQALDPRSDPARTAIAKIKEMLRQAEKALPSAALAQVRHTPIFILEHSGPGGMFHPNPDWLIAHGRTVEMLNGIEISDAGIFNDISLHHPGALIHELAHAYYFSLSDEQRAKVKICYDQAMDLGRYCRSTKYDGTIEQAYASVNVEEYFAELSETYFRSNDYSPFTRNELVAYDPDGARMIVELWQTKPF